MREPTLAPASGLRNPATAGPHSWVKLIGKLRWMGKEEEAQKLEERLRKLPMEVRGCMVAEPSDTD
jgi:hypothetical protein